MEAPIAAYSTSQLAALYEVSVRTMYSWLKPLKKELLEKQLGKAWNLRQVEIIFNHLGRPDLNRPNDRTSNTTSNEH